MAHVKEPFFTPHPKLETRNSKLGSRFRLLDLFNQRGHEVEQVSDYRVIGNFKDRSFGVLVHSDDGARALHSDDVLDSAANAKREVELRTDCLPRGPNLTIHGQPTRVANGTRRRDLASNGFR